MQIFAHIMSTLLEKHIIFHIILTLSIKNLFSHFHYIFTPLFTHFPIFSFNFNSSITFYILCAHISTFSSLVTFSPLLFFILFYICKYLHIFRKSHSFFTYYAHIITKKLIFTFSSNFHYIFT